MKSLVIFLIFICCTYFIKRYFTPAFAIMVLIIICNPIYRILHKKIRLREEISSIVSIAIVNIVLIFIIYNIGNSIMYSYGDRFISIKNLFMDLSIKLNEILKTFNVQGDGVSLKSLISTNLIKEGAKYTSDGIIIYIISNIMVYFILVDKGTIRKFLNNLFYKENVDIMINKYGDLKNIFIIESKLIVLFTLETIVGFIILGVDNAILLGIICGILDLLPYIGTSLVFIPLILNEVLKGNYIIVVGLTALYLILMITRQIMETKFIGDKLNIHPLALIISVYIGIKIFGILGVFIGPMYVITVKEFIT
ncbi:MAG: AI-2E family transporter [Clostridium sp.]